MNLIQNFMEECVVLNKIKTPDPAGGNAGVRWEEGATINVAIVKDTSLSARVAESEGVTATYTLTTFGYELEYHEVIKRKRDGLILRVTNDATEAPKVSSLNGMKQANAEKWVLTS